MLLIVTVILCVILLACIFFVMRQSSASRAMREELVAKSSEKSAAQARLEETLKQIEALQQKLTQAQGELSALRGENSSLKERIRFIDEEKTRLDREAEERFKNLSNAIQDDYTRKIKVQNEQRLAEILNPLKENIEQFKKTVAETYSTEARERYSLQEHIKELVELNQTIGKEAKDLTMALKGNSKVQGDWGEFILESILEKSGLVKGREFSVQESVRDDQGNLLRADVVINYPDGRHVIIDSKVSLTAYTNYVSTEDPEQQEIFKKQHVQSVRSHIQELKTKNYQDYIGEEKLDFVMMFIPHEPAYMAAMQFDNNLWQEAYDSRVLIISPTHLISVLRLVGQLWLHDRQTRNAIDIARESGNMYDKFVGFVEDMARIDKSLTQTRNSYESAMKKLSTGSGNLVGRAKKLKDMGAKATKSLPALAQAQEQEQEQE